MKTALVILLSIIFTVSLQSQVTIKGTVYGSDSKLIKEGLIAITSEFMGMYEQSFPIKNGKFEITSETKNAKIFLVVNAPYHSPFNIVLPSNEENIIELDMKLQPLQLPDDGVRILTEDDGFDFSKSKPLFKQPDGTYKLEIPSNKATFKYQVMYIHMFQGRPSERTSHGTAGTLSEDMAGDYISTIPVVNGKAVVVFDPSKLLKPSSDFTVTVLTEPLRTKIELDQEFVKMEREFYSKYMSYQENNSSMDGFEYDINKWNNTLFSYRAKNRDKKIQLLCDAYYILSQFMYKSDPNEKGNYDTNVAERFFKDIPYSSNLWTIENNNVFSNALSIVYKDNLEKQFQEVIKFCQEDHELSSKLSVYSSLLSQTKAQKSSIHQDVYASALKDLDGYEYLKNIVFEYNPEKRIVIGKQVPSFSLKSISEEGKEISTDKMKGNYYIIDFWATWCGPCMAEMGNLHSTYEKFKGKKGFTIVSLSFDESPQKVLNHREKAKLNMPWNHGFVKDGFKSKLAELFEVAGIPTVVLVDDKGNIVATSEELRGQNLETTLQKFLD